MNCILFECSWNDLGRVHLEIRQLWFGEGLDHKGGKASAETRTSLLARMCTQTGPQNLCVVENRGLIYDNSTCHKISRKLQTLTIGFHTHVEGVGGGGVLYDLTKAAMANVLANIHFKLITLLTLHEFKTLEMCIPKLVSQLYLNYIHFK